MSRVLEADNATAEVAAFTLSFSGEACGGELFNCMIHAIRATYIVRLNGHDIEWGYIDNATPSPRLHYREWSEERSTAVGPLRTMRIMDIEEVYVY